MTKKIISIIITVLVIISVLIYNIANTHRHYVEIKDKYKIAKTEIVNQKEKNKNLSSQIKEVSKAIEEKDQKIKELEQENQKLSVQVETLKKK